MEFEFDEFAAFRAAERTGLRDFHLALAGEARAQRTLEGLRHPALKALWWFASRGCVLPPTPDDAANYLTFTARERNNIGSVECARGAISNLCT